MMSLRNRQLWIGIDNDEINKWIEIFGTLKNAKKKNAYAKSSRTNRDARIARGKNEFRTQIKPADRFEFEANWRRDGQVALHAPDWPS